MKKIEFVYREILFQALERKKNDLTQSFLSKELRMSLSVVNHALIPLRKMNAIYVKKRGFDVIDTKKILYYWASIRNLEKDIIYKTRVDHPAYKIENSMPDYVIYGAYSAYKLKFKDVPSDYSEVYVYSNEDLKERFPESKKTANLLILKKDEFMDKYGKLTTMAQTFVDLWNIKEWYAHDFLKALEEKINGILE